MYSYDMLRQCPGCGVRHTLVCEDVEMPSDSDQFKYQCPTDGKTYRVVIRDIPIWKQEFERPEGAVVATKLHVQAP